MKIWPRANAARESLGLVRRQYNEGLTDFNRVLNVEQSLTQQEDQLAVAQGSVVQNLILVYKSLGGGWEIRCAPLPPLPPSGPPPEVVPPPSPAPAIPLPPPPTAPTPTMGDRKT